jgi:RimJ/RimL family protein N-acetyltransferase
MTDLASLQIETDRLILRVPNGDDFDRFAAMMADEETARYVGGRMNRAQAWRAWCALVGAWYVRGFSMFSVLLKDSGTWIGRIGPWMPEGWPGTEVGWGIAPEYAGKGYALEASVASIDFAFDTLGWADVMHCIDPENLPSIALAKRLGSTNRGPTQMPEPFQDYPVDNWGQSREQWQENRKQFH